MNTSPGCSSSFYELGGTWIFFSLLNSFFKFPYVRLKRTEEVAKGLSLAPSNSLLISTSKQVSLRLKFHIVGNYPFIPYSYQTKPAFWCSELMKKYIRARHVLERCSVRTAVLVLTSRIITLETEWAGSCLEQEDRLYQHENSQRLQGKWLEIQKRNATHCTFVDGVV